jgi:hypothetical protein
MVTFILIVLLKPLGFSSLDFLERAITALVISIIISACIYLVVNGLKLWFPDYMSEDHWTLGKEILLWLMVLFIITCAISVVFIGLVLYQQGEQYALSLNLILSVFLRTASFTLGLSIIPMLVLILFEQHNHHKKQYQNARQFTQLLQKQLHSVEEKQVKKEQKIIFTSETEDVELQLKPDDVIIVQSDGNYVEIHYLNGSTLQKKLIRHRLKAIESQLPEDLFFRCHNRYIVNTKRITNVKGNARGLYIEFENSNAVIPVSRSKVKAFKAIFEKN